MKKFSIGSEEDKIIIVSSLIQTVFSEFKFPSLPLSLKNLVAVISNDNFLNSSSLPASSISTTRKKSIKLLIQLFNIDQFSLEVERGWKKFLPMKFLFPTVGKEEKLQRAKNSL